MNAGRVPPLTRTRRPGWVAALVVLALMVAKTADADGQAPGRPGAEGQGGLQQKPLAIAQQPGVAVPADQTNIDRAVNFGVEFLRRTQDASGGWGGKKNAGSGEWGVGYTALPGLALIECGISPNDGGIKRAANVVRSLAYDLDTTYEASLAILFLDRVGESRDRPLIQLLAARLIAGQAPTGGWGYKLPKFSTTEREQLFVGLRKLNPNAKSFLPPAPSFRERPGSLGLCIKMSDDTFTKPTAPVTTTTTAPVDPEKLFTSVVSTLPGGMKRLAVFSDIKRTPTKDPVEQRNILFNPTTDNSNTHFAMVALWAARRHDVPTDRTFSLLIKRFRTSQAENGQWGYDYARGAAGGTPAFTCVAMLGLAIGHALEPEAGLKPEEDPKTLKAFKAMSTVVGEPVGRTDNRPTPKAAGGLYFMWAMERIGVLYDIALVGKKDWYLWGAEILLGHQLADGSWVDGGQHVEHAAVSTSLALLFLKRANLTAGLNKKLRLDSSVLTAKVGGDPPPVKSEPPPPPPPPPPVETPVDVPTPPAPTPKIETPSTPPPATTAAEPPKEKSNLPLILGLGGVVLAGGTGLFFAWRTAKKRREEEEEEERRAKKKGKGKGATVKLKKKVVKALEDD